MYFSNPVLSPVILLLDFLKALITTTFKPSTNLKWQHDSPYKCFSAMSGDPQSDYYAVILNILFLPPKFVRGFWRTNFLWGRWVWFQIHSIRGFLPSSHSQHSFSSGALGWNTDSLNTTIGRFQQKLPPSTLQKWTIAIFSTPASVPVLEHPPLASPLCTLAHHWSLLNPDHTSRYLPFRWGCTVPQLPKASCENTSRAEIALLVCTGLWNQLCVDAFSVPVFICDIY